MKMYQGFIVNDSANKIFVFGSNLEGRHGAGAARIAMQYWGAVYGQASGLQGQAYGLVTTNLQSDRYPSMLPSEIIAHIKVFYVCANMRPDLEFHMAYTHPSNLLCGYSTERLAQMFGMVTPIPDNIYFEENFSKLIQDYKQLVHENN